MKGFARKIPDVPTGDEIMSRLGAVLLEYRNDPEHAAARRALEEASALAARAYAHAEGVRAKRHETAVRIMRSDLFEFQDLVTKKLATVDAKIAARGAPPFSESGIGLVGTRAVLLQDLDRVQREIAAFKTEPSDDKLLNTPRELRQTFRDADTALRDAELAVKASKEPLIDAQAELKAAAARALARVKPRLLEVYHDSLRRLVAVFALAAEENTLAQRVSGAINHAAGGLVDDLSWFEFSPPAAVAGSQSRFEIWKDHVSRYVH